MAVFKWRRRQTKYFGEVWVPFAQISIQGRDSHFQAFSVQVDSGATVSLLRRSVADLLGYSLQAGKRIDLTGVGGAETVAYVHELHVRVGEELLPWKIPFAIADSEQVPNLLGRLGAFDRTQVGFDATFQETTIAPCWLSHDARFIWEKLVDTERYVISRWHDWGATDLVKDASKRTINQAELLIASVRGLVKLHLGVAGPLFVRALFELALQFEYMMQEPDKRAQDFLDFEHVTRYKHEQAVLHSNGPIGDHIRSSPDRPAGEQRVKENYDRVCNRFQRANGRPYRDWHGLQLRQLAERLSGGDFDWLVEYDLWYSQYSAWAHGDPGALQHVDFNAVRRGSDLLHECYCYYARILLRITDRWVLTNEQYELLAKLAKGLA